MQILSLSSSDQHVRYEIRCCTAGDDGTRHASHLESQGDLDRPGIGNTDGNVLCQALDDYTTIVRRHPGLAITEYARLSRALMLFQNGRADDAVLQLDDLRVSLVGCDYAC